MDKTAIKANIQDNKQKYGGIDLCKLLAAILIVLLHATETDNIYAVGIQYVLTRFCVPFFFVCSGFFFHTGLAKAADPKSYFLKYEKRFILLFLFWGVLISSPIVVTDYIRNNPDASPLRLILLIIRRMFVIGNGAYWYLVALIISTAFLYFCYAKKHTLVLVTAMIVGFVLQFGYTSFQGIIASIPLWNQINRLFYFVFSWEFNFVMYGIPFCGIGYLISKFQMRVGRKASVLMMLIFTVLRAAEYSLQSLSLSFWSDNATSIMFIPQAVAFFFLATNIRGIPRYAKEMRQLSTFIYLIHWIILYNILNPLLSSWLGINVYAPSLIPAKVVIVVSVCVCLNFCLRKTNNRYIHFLIGG